MSNNLYMGEPEDKASIVPDNETLGVALFMKQCCHVFTTYSISSLLIFHSDWVHQVHSSHFSSLVEAMKSCTFSTC